jgi:hypothetical protein
MLLQPPPRKDFDFRGPLQVDIDNSGFTDAEMAELAGPALLVHTIRARGGSRIGGTPSGEPADDPLPILPI